MVKRRELTSKERVLAAINHEEPDRVPIDLGSTPSSGISAIAYHKLKAHLDMTHGHTRVYDVVQQLAQPEWPIIDRFHVDVLDIGRTFNEKEDDWKDATLFDGTLVQFPAWFTPRRDAGNALVAVDRDGKNIIARMPDGGYFFDQERFPYIDGYPSSYDHLSDAMELVSWAALVHSPWDHASDPDFWTTLRENAIRLRESTDKALMVVAGCNLFEWGTFLRRMDNFLMDLIRRPYEVDMLLDALMDHHLATLEKVCEAVGDVVDILRFGDDLGENHGPFMSPGLYRKFFKPKHQELCRYVHEHSKMKTLLHACGSIRPLIPDLIDAGYDILNPVQINAKDMDPTILKKEFGEKITFWGGGADTRNILNHETPDQVQTHVEGLLDIFTPGGGFVFNPVHNILPDVPPRNIIAAFDTAFHYHARTTPT